ncbi:MAG: DUF481 domain-containing protein [Novosphingobium sp.]|nr:DUF481 domain-containing protein [Novosphingobium sp.]
MINAAIATGDADKVRTVVEIARSTNPDDLAEIDAIYRPFVDGQKRLAADKAARKEAEIREAGLLDNWSGKGELGASRSTGNSREIGVTAGLGLKREGIDWDHKLKVLVDYRRSNGVKTKEQYLLAYEPNYRISRRLFAYGLGQYERDRFQGFSSRVSVSGGLGYRVIDRKRMKLAVKGGPAWRRTWLVPDGSGSSLAALAALDFDWHFAKNLKLTEDASAYLQSDNSSFNSTTGLEAQINGNLAARLSYTVEHDTDPPPGAVRTDTLSRVTLIYDF